MRILDKLTQDHREADRLMAQLGESEPGSQRDSLIEQLTQALRRHMAVEERFVYPIVARAEGDEPVEEAHNEHDLIRQDMANLDELRSEPGFGAALEGLEATVSHHVQEEEGEVFPELRRTASQAVSKLDPAACEAAVEGIDLTRDEPYDSARDADIQGRGSLAKDELVRMLAEQ